ncbi:MAG: DUF1810 family protein [Verrucomicrobiae bacterium]|nr:DUF1810 family protein [Verrucomicrobiae bacterium]
MPDDPHDLKRFLDAQQGRYERALSELEQGRKRSHWMWFVFPQVAGLGHSGMAQRYAIRSRDEALAYLANPILSGRLQACCRALLKHRQKNIEIIMGYPDNLKLFSSMTLFACMSPPDSVFHEVLDAFYGGRKDSFSTNFLEMEG